MARPSINDLGAFVAVARERSFTRAAAQLGVSPSALSHTLRALEERFGVRLLSRTTRSVIATEAGERLLDSIGPHLDKIDAAIANLSDFRDKPAGTVRITATEHAASSILWPAVKRLLPDYPDIRVEIVIDYRLTDIVAGRYDAGVLAVRMQNSTRQAWWPMTFGNCSARTGRLSGCVSTVALHSDCSSGWSTSTRRSAIDCCRPAARPARCPRVRSWRPGGRSHRHDTGGRRCAHGRAASIWAPSASSVASSFGRPTS